MSNYDFKELCRLSVIGGLALMVMLLVLSLAGCQSTKYVPVGEVSNTKITEKETLVPILMPADSADIRALLECDENGRVVMRWFDTERSKNARLKFSLDSLGMLVAKMKTVPDTIYIPSKETIKESEVKTPVIVEVEKRLTKWQSLKIELGGWAFGGLLFCLVVVLWMIFKAIRK